MIFYRFQPTTSFSSRLVNYLHETPSGCGFRYFTASFHCRTVRLPGIFWHSDFLYCAFDEMIFTAASCLRRLQAFFSYLAEAADATDALQPDSRIFSSQPSRIKISS